MIPKSEIAADWVEAGYSHAEAGRIVGISREAVRQACKKRGIVGRTEAGRLANSAATKGLHRGPDWVRKVEAARQRNRAAAGLPTRKEIAALVERGLTYSQVAARLGITRNAVAGMVRRHKLAKSRAIMEAAE